MNYCEKTDLSGMSDADADNADVPVISINGLKDATRVLNAIIDMSADFFFETKRGQSGNSS